MKRETLAIALAGAPTVDSEQRAVGVAHALRGVLGRRIRLIALWGGRLEQSSAIGELCDERFAMPDAAVNPEDYVSQLRRVDRHMGLDVMVPCASSELGVLQRVGSVLTELGIKAAFPSAASVFRVNRLNQCQLARELGVRVPDTIALSDLAAIPVAVKRLGMPLLVRSTSGEGEWIQRVEDVTRACKVHSDVGAPVLLQESVSGEHFTVGAVRDASRGDCVVVTLCKTLVTRRSDAWCATTVHDTGVREFTERILRGLSWHGPCGLDVVRDGRGRLLLQDIHPFLPTWNDAVVRAGVNLSLLLVYLALGRRLKIPSAARVGTYCVHRMQSGEINGWLLDGYERAERHLRMASSS